jgi:hypothetical protein
MVATMREILTATPRRRTLTLFIGVGLLFTVITWFYMGSALTSCNTHMLTTLPGDATAGLTWLTWIDKTSPIPGFTHLTNAPFGESLRQPFQITSIFTIPMMWLLAKLSSPACAWNLMVFLGYMSSALAAFAFMRWLTRNAWVALFTGFAITYTPYHVLNALGHLSYMFNAVLMLFMWAFVAFWQRATAIRAALMALATAACFYLDGYFILLGGVLAGSVLLAALVADTIVDKQPAEYILQRLRGLLLYGGFLIVLLLPLAAVQLHYAHAISTTLGSERNDIVDESRTYSARVWDYFLPAANDPFFPASYGTFRTNPKVLHGSNFTESTIYVGVVVFVLAIYLWVTLIRRRISSTLRGIPMTFLAGVTTVGLLASFLISLPPHELIFGHLIPMPSDVVIHFSSLWRVFARLYLVVETCLVILAGLGLYLLIRNWPQRRQMMVTIVLILLVAIDYATVSRARTWQYAWSPAVYSWLATQPQIHTIAEYPIGEPPSDAISDYLTYQQVSGKAIINTSSSDSPERQLHLSIEGLADAQTLPVLRALGAQMVLSHHAKAPVIPGLTFVRDDKARFDIGITLYDEVWTYRIDPGPIANYAVVAAQGFHDPEISSSMHSVIGMGDHGILTLQSLTHAKSDTVHVSFTADSVRGDKLVTVGQNGVVRWQGEVTQGTQVAFDADPSLPIDVIPYHPSSFESLQIYDLQATTP